MTAEERRKKARLRSERWRRAHGIMPRRPAQRPWLAEGISRSTWYRRRKQARERQALTLVAAAREAVFDRLDWQVARYSFAEDRLPESLHFAESNVIVGVVRV